MIWARCVAWCVCSTGSCRHSIYKSQIWQTVCQTSPTESNFLKCRGNMTSFESFHYVMDVYSCIYIYIYIYLYVYVCVFEALFCLSTVNSTLLAIFKLLVPTTNNCWNKTDKTFMLTICFSESTLRYSYYMKVCEVQAFAHSQFEKYRKWVNVN